jgi:hypothetical protein
MAKYLMACGHVSNATYYDDKDKKDKPMCIICDDIISNARVVVHECMGDIGLEGRKAKCIEGDSIVDSKWDLPLFQYLPNREYDRYYCGCCSWN